MKRVVRSLAALSVLTATIAVFAHYISHHPEVRHQLGDTPIGLLVAILALNILGILALAGVTNATIRLCKATLTKSESILLTAYSSVINFFGPLQSGPAFRAVYLKRKHGVNYKNYGTATLVYYFAYGLISGLFLLSGVFKWWTFALIALIPLLIWGLNRHPRISKSFSQLDLHNWYYLAFATFMQVAIVTVIYYLELRYVAPGTSLDQAIVYAGAANLALFVSFTPGAIGFRESFLLFSQNLHHIDSATIVTANVIDRGVYVVLLLLLSVFIFGTHASRRLKVSEESA